MVSGVNTTTQAVKLSYLTQNILRHSVEHLLLLLTVFNIRFQICYPGESEGLITGKNFPVPSPLEIRT
ncbi:hypothetical protein CV014_28255 [Nostoc sp. CMAA1605]|nr:hypothetical protein [Nostoc sp. CMAA1605]